MATKNPTESEKRNDPDAQSLDESHEGRYKVGCWALGFLQCCNNPKGFLVFMFIAVLAITIMSGGLLNVNVASLERRFGLDSTQSGLIVIGYEVGFLIMTLFISYFGMNASRPKMCAIGAVVFGLGSLIYSLPHFTTNNYNFGHNGLQVTCPLPGATPSTTCIQSENLTNFLGLFLFANILMGMGATPFFTLGFSYIEDSVPKRWGPVYLGIVNAGALIGPVIGFVAGGRFLLDQFVDFDKGITPGFTYVDARWVGAWWVVPLIAMAIAWITAIPLAGFPKQLPGTNKVRAARISETHNDGGSQMARTTELGKIRDFPKAFWIIIRNPVFVLLTISACFQGVFLNGVSAFFTKFLENEFHLATGRAAELSGSILVPAGALGHIIAGILMTRLKWKTPTILKFSIACLVVAVCLAPISFLHCNNLDVSGLTVSYNYATQLPTGGAVQVSETLRAGNLTAGCNANCACQEEFYIPVCGDDGKTYFSPCHAGCFGANFNNGSILPYEYTNCQCVPSTTQKATPGVCSTACGTPAAFLAVMFINVMLSIAPLTPSLVMTFRVVPEKMRPFAVGVQWLFVRGIGTIPGPLIYGALINLTCILWQTRQCDGSRGSCWIYSNREMNIVFVCMAMVVNTLAAITYVIAYFVYKPQYGDFAFPVKPTPEIPEKKTPENKISGTENACYEELSDA